MLPATERKVSLPVSGMAETLTGSEIIKLAGEISEIINKGEKVHNLTIGDFDPEIFPIPEALKEGIISAYRNNQTNYPAANGIPELRKAVSSFLAQHQGLSYSAEEILIACGARPLIYAVYRTLVDPGDQVLFPVPSWNNNHYSHLTAAEAVFVEALPGNRFMPSASQLEPYLLPGGEKAGKVRLVALCSPLNPTGTTFRKDDLAAICDLVLEANSNLQPGEKPVYLLFDQIYWMLTFGSTRHHDPVSLRPAMRHYTIYVDGISKSFAATGVRIGWAMGPQRVMDKMRSILSHVGAWAPKAEQVACAAFLADTQAVEPYLQDFKKQVSARLHAFYEGFMKIKKEGYRVDATAPEAAIYLTVKIDLAGMQTADGKTLHSNKEVASYLLEKARVALVPFYAFGSAPDSPWYRLSVGTCRTEEIPQIMEGLGSALGGLR